MTQVILKYVASCRVIFIRIGMARKLLHLKILENNRNGFMFSKGRLSSFID